MIKDENYLIEIVQDLCDLFMLVDNDGSSCYIGEPVKVYSIDRGKRTGILIHAGKSSEYDSKGREISSQAAYQCILELKDDHFEFVSDRKLFNYYPEPAKVVSVINKLVLNLEKFYIPINTLSVTVGYKLSNVRFIVESYTMPGEYCVAIE